MIKKLLITSILLILNNCSFDTKSGIWTEEKIKLGKGSAIFLHLTQNYKSTAGCIALRKKDFLIRK